MSAITPPDATSQDAFDATVKRELTLPLTELIDLLGAENNDTARAFFSEVVERLKDPGDEANVLMAVIDLSRCAFIGLQFSDTARVLIDHILENAITLSHTMSAEGESN